MKPPISIAPRYTANSRSGESESNFGIGNTGSAGVSVSNSQANAQAIEQQQQVDSALLNALANSRERMAVLQVEKLIVDFMRTK